MVYCGKPSRGCQMCRTRRIKCDETKPTCLQCQKSRRQCPGYKDDFDLVFRNETKATERRARRALNTGKLSSHVSAHVKEITVSDSVHHEPSSHHTQAQALARTNSLALVSWDVLSTPVDDQAPCYFVSSYVLKTDNASRGYFEFLLPMLETQTPDSSLSIAFSAVALASFANRPNAKQQLLTNQAVYRYSKALKATNLALQDPKQQKSDQTLASVLLLGFYEALMNHRSNASAWGSHIDGAVEIVRMRGRKQLRTKIGQALFTCVRNFMTTHCVTASKPPALGLGWWHVDGQDADFHTFVTNMTLQLAELRFEVNIALATYPRTPEFFQKVVEFVRRAYALEQGYQNAIENLSRELLPREAAWVDHFPGVDVTKEHVSPGRVEMFDDILVAWTWNYARIARLYIFGLIIRCAAWISFPLDYRKTPEYATLSKVCIELVNDIIASIPYQLGWRVGHGDPAKAGDFKQFNGKGKDYTEPTGLGGYLAMYPLMCVACTDWITESQRLWAHGRLYFISDFLGMRFARVLACFQLRLPSMAIHRDMFVHSPTAAAAIMAAAAAAARGAGGGPSPKTSSTDQAQNVTPATPSTLSTSMGSSPAHLGTSPVTPTPLQNEYTDNSLPQNDTTSSPRQSTPEREQFLKKASNFQGDIVKGLIASYLAV